LATDENDFHTTEDYHAVLYDLNTGEIFCVLGAPEWEALMEKGQAAIDGFHIIENYPDKENIIQNPGRYIFDLEENRVREMTEEELDTKEEKLRRLRLQNILQSMVYLPDGRIRATLSWATYRMYIETNSSVLGVRFDSASKQLYIEISGTSGTSGILDLIVPQELIPSVDDVAVYLDGSPIDFTLTKLEDYYSIHVEYTHSTRTLTVSLTALPAWYTQPLNLALIGVGVVAALGAVYWFKFRK
jgi:hypothetical protein